MGGRRRIPGILVGLCVLVASMGSGCALTGISRGGEVRIGQQLSAEIDRQYHTYQDPVLTRVGERVAAACGTTDYPFSYKVIEQEEVNAFALPGGPVYVTEALLRMTDGHPEWLAAVVAHETAHVSLRHLSKLLRRQAWLGLGIDILTGGVLHNVAILVANIEELGYSRNQERQADTHGAAYLVRAEIDPGAMVVFFRELYAANKEGKGGPSFLRTHPSTPDRIARIQEQIDDGTIHRLAKQPGP